MIILIKSHENHNFQCLIPMKSQFWVVKSHGFSRSFSLASVCSLAAAKAHTLFRPNWTWRCLSWWGANLWSLNGDFTIKNGDKYSWYSWFMIAKLVSKYDSNMLTTWFMVDISWYIHRYWWLKANKQNWGGTTLYNFPQVWWDRTI